jgi:tetratricopeptide (TPR) repeat protein
VPSASDLHEQAVALINAGRHGAARRVLERASAGAERADADLVAAVGASLAYLDAEEGDRERALRRCEEALALDGVSATVRGSILSQHALLLMLAGATEQAHRELDEAVHLLADDPKFLGRAHSTRGNLYLQQNDLGRAAQDFARAVDHLGRAGLDVEAAMDEHNLGYVRFLAGDLVAALQEMDRARIVLAPLSAVVRATCDQDRAEVLVAAGRVAEGRVALSAAAEAYGSRRLRRRQAEAELILARSYLDDAPASAAEVARRAARRFEAASAREMWARAQAVVIVAEAELGRDRGLAELGSRIADDLSTQGIAWQAAAVRLSVARVTLRQDGHQQARRVVRAARVGARSPMWVRLLQRQVLADLAVASGRRGTALMHVRAGLAEVHAWQSSFGSLDLQTGVAGHGVRLGVRGLALAVESRKPAVLLEWSERARMLASRVQPVQAPEDEQLVADLAELRELASGEGRGDPVRETELRQRVRERAWQHRGSGEVADPVGLTELQAALDPETALVAYVVTADVLVALVVTDADAIWVDLGARSTLDDLVGGLLPDLDVAAADLAQPMAGAVRAALAARLDELAALLVAPVLDAVGDRRVVLTPSGVLAGMPWTLLPGYVGRPVTVAQSATSWLARRTTPLRTRTAGFVAGPRVMRAEDEVNAAVKEWPAARVLTGASATAAAVSELAEQVDVLHVAAHGRHSAENPLFSGLMLADGSWFGYDIDRLRSVPDVVLLSACEVGRSTVRWGEELIGMSAAWLHAGARCVIASAAAVNDAAAYDVLVAVHQQLAAGVDPATALAEAVPAVTTGTAPVPLVCFG